MIETKMIPKMRDALAPDGSDVRLLLGLKGGGMAQFSLAAGKTSIAVTHRTVEEIWFFLSGHGQMWRQMGKDSETVDVHSGVCLTIPLGTHFQFRSLGKEPLTAIGVMMPPWPGDGEAVVVTGPWTVAEGGVTLHEPGPADIALHLGPRSYGDYTPPISWSDMKKVYGRRGRVDSLARGL
jgi:mannose-6-phosphate isomerase-like protein (cupin superfamily)